MGTAAVGIPTIESIFDYASRYCTITRKVIRQSSGERSSRSKGAVSLMEPAVVLPGSTSSSLPPAYQGTRWYRLLRLLGAVVGLCTLGIFLASIPAYYASLEAICRVPVCPPGQLRVAQVEQLHTAGISLTAYAVLLVALAMLSGACWSAVAVVLFLRGPSTYM